MFGNSDKMIESFVSAEQFIQQLGQNTSRLIILDCRSSNEYSESHIRQAVNFSIPSIMLRRLAAGTIELISTIKCRDLKARITDGYRENLFVIYGEDAHNNTIEILTKRLIQDGCSVACLQGGFLGFRSRYPEWCESDSADTTAPLMGLRSLRISSGSSSSSSCGGSSDAEDSALDRCDSSLGMEEDREFPVEILPFLFLGNAANSEDSEALQRHRIQYILNVTQDLPNVYEGTGNIQYMKIPIADHMNQNLACFFPQAIEFIDEARSNEKGVLVHCLAGVSRSVTITVAYLMYKLSLSMNDAFNIVRRRKTNIAPNFNFMQQLDAFDQELRATRGTPLPLLSVTAAEPANKRTHPQAERCTCGRPDCTCPPPNPHFLSPLLPTGASPDSGIEFDRWSSVAE